MKKLSFFLMAMLVSLTSFAAALGEGYEKVTDISKLAAGDRVVVYCDGSSIGVTGWNGSKDATVAAEGWVEYLVEAASNGVYLKDEKANNYIASPGSSNQFKYGTKGVCSVDANGVLKCNSRFLCHNDQNGNYYRMYTAIGSYKPFYVYKVVPVEVDPDATIYTVTVKSADETMGTVAGGGEYAEGKTATLEATPKAGYEFVKWSNESTDNPLQITVTGDIELTATFQAQVPITIAEANKLADNATCTLNEFTVTYVFKSYTHIQDASGYGMIYKSSFGLKAGDVVSGFTCTKSSYNGLPQFIPTCALADLTVTAGEAPAVAEVTTAPTGNYHQVVKLVNVKMAAGEFTTSANKTLTATCPDGTTIAIYNNKNVTATFVADKTYNITGDVCQYSGKIQVSAYAVEEYVAPVTKYTVTLSDNTGGFEPLTSGAGEYEEGDEVTVSAVDSEGWVFVGWMDENGDIVSNDYQYTFVIESNVEFVAIYAQFMELEVNDLEIITEPVVALTGTAELKPGMTLSFKLIVDNSEQGEDGEFYLTEDSKVYLNDETELEFQEGIALIDMKSKIAQAQVLAAMGETLYLFKLDMSAAPAEPVDLVVTDATIYEENEILFLTAPWEGKTIKAELPATEHQGWMMIEIQEGEDFSIAMSQNATIATVDNVLTITGVFADSFTGDIYNVNISGTLPVVEPTTITYELNGGELPKVKVPTNAELWGTDTADVNGFMHYYNHYYGLKRATQTIENVATFASAKMQEIMTDEASEYKWLGDYVQSVATAAGVPLSTDMAAANEGGWRWSVWAFFNACAGKNGSAGIDFTEAGKPENWGPAYQAAHEVVLPTEPVAEDYVLPTPVKEGYTFVGWYDNAEGTGEAYTVIPAGWAGTLYAIWKQSPATALDNIAIEGKVVKTIINGQLIIIKNGVQYNAQGQVIK